MSGDSTNLKQEFTAELESILESDEAYGSNVQILTYVFKEGVINGKFKDSWNNKVYEFIIDTGGISYKPAFKLDSFSADEAPVRFDSYSEGYGSLFEDARIDGKLTGKRTKKPKCGNSAYGCGFSCIGIQKTCRISASGGKTGSAIGKERLNKLRALGDKIVTLGGKGALILASDIKGQITKERGAKAGQLREERRQRIGQQQVKTATESQGKKPAKPKPEPPLNNMQLSNKEFKTIGNAETREKLNQWIKMTAEIDNLADETEGVDIERVESAVMIIASLFKMMKDESANFGGVVDSNGKLQATYTYKETDKGYDVDYLASAPWNCLESHPDKKVGAGASAIEAIVRTAISKSKGQVNLESTENAVPFYEKVGFKRQKKEGMPNWEIHMSLDEKSAKQFLANQEKKNRKDADLTVNDDNLTELERLEEQVLGLFTIPQDIRKKVIKEIELKSNNN
jgi:hypothetical protein